MPPAWRSCRGSSATTKCSVRPRSITRSVTVRSTNGYVFPRRTGRIDRRALPMGARLRLKASVNLRVPGGAQKIFRAMKRHGLIVADNGSDMYISGTFDTRWNNGVLNPAFSGLSASDFEVVQLGWQPQAGSPPADRQPRLPVGMLVTGTAISWQFVPLRLSFLNLDGSAGGGMPHEIGGRRLDERRARRCSQSSMPRAISRFT